MTMLSISLTFDDTTHRPALPAGVHHIAEIMPAILASQGLSMPDDANVKPTVAASEVVIGVMLDALEAALAS
jgi:hypothetical protein